MNKNGLKIKVLNGETACGETEFFFDHTHSYIVVGRDQQHCQIAFNASAKDQGIGHEHIAFKRSLGHYQLDLHADHYVEVNGEVPFEEQELRGKNRLKLGIDIHIEVEVIDTRDKVPLVGEPHVQPGKLSRDNKKRLSRIALLSGVIAVLLIAVSASVFRLGDTVETTITTAVNDISKELDRLEQESAQLTQTVIDRVSRSVYLVLVVNDQGGEKPQGTAWVTENEQMATNAHVAAAFNELKRGEHLVVRASYPPYTTHKVTSVLLHPGFDEYLRLWSNYIPTQKSEEGLEVMSTTTPADVALMMVENGDQLSPSIPLATPEELRNLQAGMRVGYVGFPMERLLPGSFKSPAPVAQQDEIIRVTDFFMVKREDNRNRLIQHGLPLTGGASGSPIINAQGKVIALVSAMNAEFNERGVRFANPADVNFGQRVDFLYDLLDRQHERATRALMKQWQQSMELFIPAREGSRDAIVDAVKQIFDIDEFDEKRPFRKSLKVDASNRYTQMTQRFQMPERGLYLFTLISAQPEQKMEVSGASHRISRFALDLPFDDFAAYELVLAHEPGVIELEMSFPNYKDGSEKLNYELSMWHKTLSMDKAHAQLSQAVLQRASGSKRAPTLVQSASLQLKERSGSRFVTGVEIALENPGLYSFLSVPDQYELDALLLDQNNNSLEKDRSSNASGLIFYRHRGPKPQVVKFVVLSEKPDTTAAFSAYFLELSDKE